MEVNQSNSFLGGQYHPWRRFFARHVDIVFFGVAGVFLSYTVGYAFVSWAFPESVGWYSAGCMWIIKHTIFLFIFFVIFCLLFETLFLATAGTTPAKWLFGIRINNVSGDCLSLSSSLKRTCLVWVKGLGFGIPFILLIPEYYGYKSLTKTGTTSWDNSVGSIVTHRKWSFFRALFCVLAVLIVIIIFSVGNK